MRQRFSLCLAVALHAAIVAPTIGQTPQTMVFDISGMASYAGRGNPLNESFSHVFDEPVRIIGIGSDVEFTAFGPSWLSEGTIEFRSMRSGVSYNPFIATESPGTEYQPFEGFIDLDGDNLAITIGHDDELTVELYESFDDGAVAPDGAWGQESFIAVRYLPADLVSWGVVVFSNPSGLTGVLQDSTSDPNGPHPFDTTAHAPSPTPGLIADLTVATLVEGGPAGTRAVTIELLTDDEAPLAVPGLSISGELLDTVLFYFGDPDLQNELGIDDPRRNGPPSGTFTLLGENGSDLFSTPLDGSLMIDDGSSFSLFITLSTPGIDFFSAHITGFRWDITYPLVERNGDMNCDGATNLLDVELLCLAVNDPASYAANYPGCHILAGDLNGDLVVDALDEPLFCGLLLGTPGVPSPGCVPCLAPGTVVVDDDFGTIFADAEAIVATVQDGIDLVADGGAVRIKPGTYREHTDLGTKSLVLTSDPLDAEQVIVSGDLDDDGIGDGRPITIAGGQGIETQINGITFADGRATPSSPGGADGGGMLIDASTPSVNRCNFENNVALARGGGIAVRNTGFSEPGILLSQVKDNSAPMGGGIFVEDAAVTFSHTRIEGNRAETGSAQGGGVFSGASAITILDTCLIANNFALDNGSGIMNGPGSQASTIIVSSTISANGPTPAIHTGEPLEKVSFFNTIIAGNSAPQIGGTGRVDAHQTMIPGGYASLPGVFDADPALNPDYSLAPGSPAIDAGDNFSLSPQGELFDLLEQERFVDDPATPDTGFGFAPIVDIGAIEFVPVCTGDTNGDLAVNILDLNIVLGNFQQSGTPGFPGDLNEDGLVNITDLNIVLGNFGQGCL